jgi:hypothetical protein
MDGLHGTLFVVLGCNTSYSQRTKEERKGRLKLPRGRAAQYEAENSKAPGTAWAIATWVVRQWE